MSLFSWFSNSVKAAEPTRKDNIKEITHQGTVYDAFSERILRSDSSNVATELLFGGQILVLKSVFTATECEKLISLTESLGYESIEHLYDLEYRNNKRVLVDDSILRDDWLGRIKIYIMNYLVQLEGQHIHDAFEDMNPRLRICRYEAGGIFQRHRDGHVSFPSSDANGYRIVSRYTVLAYLNDVPEEFGGATRFYDDDSNPRDKVQPEQGLVVIFPHRMLHDGQLCTAPCKYVVRTDLLFREDKLFVAHNTT